MGVKLYLRDVIKHHMMVKVSRRDKHEFLYGKKINLCTNLTKTEKLKIKALWGNIVPNIEDGYLAYRIYKQLYGFNENFVPVSYFYPHLMWNLNSKDVSNTMSHKGMMPIIFKDILQPAIIINCINKNIFDSNYNILTIDDAVQLIISYDDKVIIKPSTDTSSGKNVRILDTNISSAEIKNILKLYGDNYVVQVLVEQSLVTSQLNPTSLQTMRINTLLLNGECTAIKSTMRCGGVGQIVDNLNAGGFMVGISSDGRLNRLGYSFDGQIHNQTNGFKLHDIIIPNFKNVVNTAIKCHIKYLPNCSFVAWDFSLTKDNKPILIEANLKFPSCFGVQLCTSPLFGERTQEVIDYVKNHKNKHRLFY